MFFLKSKELPPPAALCFLILLNLKPYAEQIGSRVLTIPKDVADIAQRNIIRIKDIIKQNSQAQNAFISFLNGLQENINKSIGQEEAQLYTDTSPLYKGYKNRKTVNHTIGEYAIGNNYTNTIEGAFSQFKRYLNGTHHQVSEKHLDKYINVFTFRFNNRKESKTNLFNLALLSMLGKRLQYTELVS